MSRPITSLNKSETISCESLPGCGVWASFHTDKTPQIGVTRAEAAGVTSGADPFNKSNRWKTAAFCR